MNETQNLVGLVIQLLEPSPIYAATKGIADVLIRSLTPVLLIIAIYLRVLETQVASIVSGPKWSEALKDIAIWGVVIGGYYEIASLIINFANAIYAWLDHFGSLTSITGKFDAILTAAKAKMQTQS